MKKIKRKKGMTLIEIIISLALLGIIIVPISGYALGSLKNNLKAEIKQSASFHGQRFLEEIKAYDEIVIKTNGEGKKYFELLDGEVMEEVSLNNYKGEVIKDKLNLQMEVKEDTTFEYNDINNLENIKNETFRLNLKESLGISNIELKQDTIQNKDFLGNLLISVEPDFSMEVKDSSSGELLINYKPTNNPKNIMIIYVDKSSTLNKTIQLENKTDKLINVYVVKHNESTANLNVIGIEGSILINDDIDLYEDNIEGKRFNYTIKIEDKNNNLLFKGSSSRNLIIK
ncbi:type II secretion system protein [Clostridium sp.]|uniref:type IV pilus modification PilV family protein n=1 Tax=Clostridium sp. TaxID=1506 RepID=UPI00290F771E|nr:type II secretion system protein [Clostridium sp.]MDU5107372.1 type II secretion system protein [Clostridium sp.]